MKLVSWTLAGGLAENGDAVIAWLEANEPVVVCLRETRVPDGDFPLVPLWELGYYTKLHAPEGAPGLAILSIEPPRGVARGADGSTMSGHVAGVCILNAAPRTPISAIAAHRDAFVAPHDQLLVVGAEEAPELEAVGVTAFANARLAPKCVTVEPADVPAGEALCLTLEGLPPPRIPDLDITS